DRVVKSASSRFYAEIEELTPAEFSRLCELAHACARVRDVRDPVERSRGYSRRFDCLLFARSTEPVGAGRQWLDELALSDDVGVIIYAGSWYRRLWARKCLETFISDERSREVYDRVLLVGGVDLLEGMYLGIGDAENVSDTEQYRKFIEN